MNAFPSKFINSPTFYPREKSFSGSSVPVAERALLAGIESRNRQTRWNRSTSEDSAPGSSKVSGWRPFLRIKFHERYLIRPELQRARVSSDSKRSLLTMCARERMSSCFRSVRPASTSESSHKILLSGFLMVR